MITAKKIAGLRWKAIDIEETKRLEGLLAQRLAGADPPSLTKGEFDEIVKWKLGGQMGRVEHLLKSNTDEVIREVTGAALRLRHKDADYEMELRLKILCSLRGIGVPVASAVLALVFPKKYAVIDYRVWRQVFDEKRSAFSISDYRKYLPEICRLADQLNWTVQEVDHAIWEYDRRRTRSENTCWGSSDC